MLLGTPRKGATRKESGYRWKNWVSSFAHGLKEMTVGNPNGVSGSQLVM